MNFSSHSSIDLLRKGDPPGSPLHGQVEPLGGSQWPPQAYIAFPVDRKKTIHILNDF
jgi:hypothetical protein